MIKIPEMYCLIFIAFLKYYNENIPGPIIPLQNTVSIKNIILNLQYMHNSYETF